MRILMSLVFGFLILPSLVLTDLRATEKEKPHAEKVSVTRHSATIAGKKIDYTATAGTLHIKDSDGKVTASMFYMAYVRDAAGDVSDRPLTFSFNGGPGSSSVWLHLGVLGPKRVRMDEDGNPYPPPYELVNNEYSILDKTDLVFIDPVSTGYSRPAPEEDESAFHGLEEDISSVGEFVRLYVSRNQRWSSPKFLIGESYGTTRAAGLVHHLQGRHGMYFNGVMLVSAILNFQTARFNEGNNLPYPLFLPTYTATAWYHGKLDASLTNGGLEAAVQQARDFALGPYATALIKGDLVTEQERSQVVSELARLTGLEESFIERENLRVAIWEFVNELMRDDYRRAGRLDSRFKGIVRNGGASGIAGDPSFAAIMGPYTATLNDYVRGDLKFESDLVYEILYRMRNWNYSNFENAYVNVSTRIREALVQNPDLMIRVYNGYYDLATPFFAAEYTFDQLNLDPEQKDNISMTYYEAGHMMYIHIPSLKKMKEDLDSFIDISVQK